MAPKKKNEIKLQRCKICNEYFQKNAMNEHIDKMHPIIRPETKATHGKAMSIILCPQCGEYFDGDAFHLHAKHCSGKSCLINKPKIIQEVRYGNNSEPRKKRGAVWLISRRGTRVNDSGFCSECGVFVPFSWRYKKSNKGTVYICDECKIKVVERSYGKIDAFTSAIQGGAFEMNRRRH